MDCPWLEKVMNPMGRMWNGVAIKLGIRKRSLVKLRRDVRACEYEDVHVMWEMLRRNEMEYAKQAHEKGVGNRGLFNGFKWGYLCQRF